MDQKLENMLALALQTPTAERRRTQELNVGYDGESRTWELIVKYHGSLEALKSLGVTVEYLLAGYAILTVPEGLVERVTEVSEIEYVEKPKRFFYEAIGPAEGSCIPQVTRRAPDLTGAGVLIGVLDSGIDYRLPMFLRPDGSTRIRFLWDQTLPPGEGRRPPEGFSMGAEFDQEQINAALSINDPISQFEALPTVDAGGHGTAVSGIAAGAADGYLGVAPEAELLIVRLGLPDVSSFPRTTEIMRGVTYVVNKALAMEMPLAVNLSFGNSYGAHDGSSLLEQFLDSAAQIGRTAICVGSGNEGANGGHLAGAFAGEQSPAAQAELAVAEYERTLSVQLWKSYSDVYRIRLRSPGGQEAELSPETEGGKYELVLEGTKLLAYFGEPAPYSAAQEIYLEFLPAAGPYIDSGVWTFLIEPVRVAAGRYDFYLPSGAVRNAATGFYRSTPQVTLTIPSTAGKVITVGAYDSTYDAYADFSGRGYGGLDGASQAILWMAKPDLVAPGVGILAPDVYGGLIPVTGTSFAAPIVSGSAALLMEWGIVRGNDPYLYGEKLKAYLRRGAQPLRGQSEVPDPKNGWGRLCLAESLP